MNSFSVLAYAIALSLAGHFYRHISKRTLSVFRFYIYRYIYKYYLPVMTTKTVVETVDPVREERTGKVREVGSQAIWSLSSCKPGISETVLKFKFQ
jgi:hypothetical protein